MQSDWRGEKRMTSAPKRAMSKRLDAVAISSIAQQARPIGIGHMELVRTQLIDRVSAGDDDLALDLAVVGQFGVGGDHSMSVR